jgi:predicted membrane-bound mannosyltransferase
MKIESPVFILSALGTLIALIKARHRFAIFSAFWAFGMLTAYTLIPYKTPWLALSFLLPMCIIGGYGINELLASKHIGAKIAGGLLAIAALIVMTYQSYELNFVRYDDDSMPYVYAHTRREFLELVSEIDRFADKSGKGKEAVIQIVSPDYWPLVWYVKDYKHANFFGRMVDADNAEMIIAKKNDQDAEAIRRFAANYEYEGSYTLRPGVDLMLLVRKDIADPDAEQLYRIQNLSP